MRPSRTLVAARRQALRGVVGVAAISFLCSLGVLAVPLFNMQVFNRVLPTRDPATLLALMAGMAAALLIYVALDTLRGMALERLAANVTNRLALPVLDRTAGRGAPGAAEALADLETLRSFFTSPACTAPFDALWTPLMLAALLAMHWAFAVLGLLCCLVLAGLNVLGDVMSRQAMLSANAASAASLRGAADAVGAAEAVLGNNMLPTLARRWETSQRRAAALVHRAVLRSRLVSAITNALRLGMTGAMVGLGLVLMIAGQVGGGSLVASNMILARLLLPFQQVASNRRRWVDAYAAWRRIAAALEAPAPARYAAAMPAPIPRLVVERLVFAPPGADRPLLRGVSFTAEPGECIGVIGPSSAGKSTLLRLIMGMAPPAAGGAYLDGTSTYLWQRTDFARHVGYVPQGLALLDADLAANIARMDAPDMPGVIAAAKRAGLHRIAARLPHGYATRLAGAALSSGQRQRVAIARALYAPAGTPPPGLLVLDEPSAFLDADGEAELAALLARLREAGTTVLVATHRPALLATADKLLVLAEGAVRHFGPRDQVMRSLSAPSVRLVPARERAS